MSKLLPGQKYVGGTLAQQTIHFWRLWYIRRDWLPDPAPKNIVFLPVGPGSLKHLFWRFYWQTKRRPVEYFVEKDKAT